MPLFTAHLYLSPTLGMSMSTNTRTDYPVELAQTSLAVESATGLSDNTHLKPHFISLRSSKGFPQQTPLSLIAGNQTKITKKKNLGQTPEIPGPPTAHLFLQKASTVPGVCSALDTLVSIASGSSCERSKL
jgi:hypothetical protein